MGAPGRDILNYEGKRDAFNRLRATTWPSKFNAVVRLWLDETIVPGLHGISRAGQSFFQASGDGGADLPGGPGLTGMPLATIVGGTSLNEGERQEGGGGGGGGGVSFFGGGEGRGIFGDDVETAAAGRERVRHAGLAAGLSMSANLGLDGQAGIIRTWRWSRTWSSGWLFQEWDSATVGARGVMPQVRFMALVTRHRWRQTGRRRVLNPAIITIGKGPFTAYTNAMHESPPETTSIPKSIAGLRRTTGYENLTPGWGSPRGKQYHYRDSRPSARTDFIVYPRTGRVNGCARRRRHDGDQAAPSEGFSGGNRYTISGLRVA